MLHSTDLVLPACFLYRVAANNDQTAIEARWRTTQTKTTYIKSACGAFVARDHKSTGDGVKPRPDRHLCHVRTDQTVGE